MLGLLLEEHWNEIEMNTTGFVCAVAAAKAVVVATAAVAVDILAVDRVVAVLDVVVAAGTDVV